MTTKYRGTVCEEWSAPMKLERQPDGEYRQVEDESRSDCFWCGQEPADHPVEDSDEERESPANRAHRNWMRSS